MNRRSKKRNCCSNRPETVSVWGVKALVPRTSAFSSRHSTPNVDVLHVPMWKWLRPSISLRVVLKVPGKSQGGPKVAGGHGKGSGGSMKTRSFWYREALSTPSHQDTGRVWMSSVPVNVSVD